ncbi:MAG: sodium:solute symporter [Bacteroidota bacterium]
MIGLPAIFILLGYFLLLFVISRLSASKSDALTFFIANRNTPWPMVAYGMIGVAISGITFISVPGQVQHTQFAYFQMVIGYSIGLIIVAFLLLPIFYRIKAISIYSYLGQRFGPAAHRTGSIFFIISQSFMASVRLYLMAHVLQILIFSALGLPFWVSVIITLLLIFFYTYRGGIKTVIITDVLQTTLLILAAIISIFIISQKMNLSIVELGEELSKRNLSDTFHWGWKDPNNFWKMIFAGIVLTVMSNGIDQAVMQKHLTCRTLWDSQKNLVTLALILLVVNLLFLFLGGALFLYADAQAITIPEKVDDLYPVISMNNLGSLGQITFILGIAAAAYSSADSSLTGLTTSFCMDILKMDEQENNERLRKSVHFGFAILIFLFILFIEKFLDSSMLNVFIRVTGFVYGPLLSLFVFGLATKRTVSDQWILPICILAPVLSLALDLNSTTLLNGYVFGHEILIVVCGIAFLGLFLFSSKKTS